ncbi:translocation/assembly module TamB domain-containing protein [Ferrimonas sp.]|uniref:autotransporter assembly complex protein TamB n=1 Tax=Ferrimonas sp. TaxID=2080861 RepID=UPI003A8E546D
MTWRRLLSFLLGVPLAILVALALLVGTRGGTALLMAAADTLVPGLTIEKANGRLNRDLHLSKVAYKGLDGLSVTVDNLTLDWRPSCLLHKTLCSDRLMANGVAVDIDTDLLGGDNAPDTEAESETEGDPHFSLPFTIQAKLLQLSRVRVRVDDMHFAVGQLSGSALFDPSELKVNRLNATQIAVYIPLTPSTEETIAPQAQADDDSWAMAALPRVALPFPIDANNIKLSRGLVTIGGLVQRLQQGQFDANWRGTLLQVDQLDAEHEWANVSLYGSLDFQGPWPLDAKAEGTIAKLPWTPGLEGQALQLTAAGSLGKLKFDVAATGQQQAQASGEITLASPTLDYQVQLSGERLSWPFGDAPDYRVSEVRLSSSGNLRHQRLTLEGASKLWDYPSFRLNGEFEHQPGLLTVHQASLESERGGGDLKGQLQYGDLLSWQAQLDTRALELATLSPKLPLVVSGQGLTRGAWDGKLWSVSLSQADLEGRFDGDPFTLKGTLAASSDGKARAKELDVLYRGSQLTADGGSEPEWQMKGKLALADLARWDSRLRGEAQLAFSVSGATDQPKIQLELEGQQLAFETQRLNRLMAKGWYQPTQNHGFMLNLSATDLDLAGEKFSLLTLDGDGDITEQSAILGLEGSDTTPWGGELAMAGKLDPNFTWWQGVLSGAKVTTPLGLWQQQEAAPVTFSFASQAFVISEHCWQGPAATLCLPIPANVGSGGAVKMALTADLPRTAEPLLPPQFSLDTQLTAELDTTWLPGHLPQLRAQVHSDQGTVLVKADPRRAQVQLPWQRLDLDATLSDAGLDLTLELDDDAPLIRSRLHLEPQAPYAMNGELTLNSFDLAPLTKAVPRIAALEGLVTANLSLGGDLTTPLLNGDLDLRQGRLASLTNPTELSEIEIELDLTGQRADIDTELMVGDGPVQASGWLDWSKDTLHADIELLGDRLDILQPPLLIAEASPTLRFRKDDKAMAVTGRIDIPKAALTLSQLPEGGVALSDDVQFVDNRPDTEAEPPAPFAMDIQLNVGEEVTVEGLGISGNLGGQLTMRQKAYQTPQLFGDISLHQGKFRAFGQQLTIRRGKVLFNGPPSLPTLDVEAIREIKSENVIAGVRLSGVVTEPTMTLFSNPSMEQQEILSYITQGRGLGGTDNGNALWASAAVNLGLAQTGGMLSTLGEELGFSEVRVGTEGDGDDTQVAISGYLGEKVFLKYGVNIFEPITEVTVRYYLQNRLWIEGINNTLKDSLDIYYSFDIE